MKKVDNTRFVPKREGKDWLLIAIILFTIVVFGFIFYGAQYFDSFTGSRDSGNSSQLRELVEQRNELEKQLDELEKELQ